MIEDKYLDLVEEKYKTIERLNEKRVKYNISNKKETITKKDFNVKSYHNSFNDFFNHIFLFSIFFIGVYFTNMLYFNDSDYYFTLFSFSLCYFYFGYFFLFLINPVYSKWYKVFHYYQLKYNYKYRNEYFSLKTDFLKGYKDFNKDTQILNRLIKKQNFLNDKVNNRKLSECFAKKIINEEITYSEDFFKKNHNNMFTNKDLKYLNKRLKYNKKNREQNIKDEKYLNEILK